jgi:hypothetical protein
MDPPAAGAATWVARPMMGTPTLPGAVRWGVIHAPTGRWVAFGSEARCRALAAHLTEVDAILRRPGAADAAGWGARR